MTKVEFARKVKNEIGKVIADLTIEDTEKVIDAVFDTLKAELKEQNKASLFGFGTFEIAKREGRKGKTPAGKEYIGQTKNIVKFKAAAALKREVNGQ